MIRSLAICEWIFGGRPLAGIATGMAACGIDAIELAGEPERPDRDTVVDALGVLRASGVTPMGRWPTAERDLCHAEAAARRQAVHYYERCVDLCVLTGAPQIGVVPVSAGRLAPLTDTRREWDFAIEGVRAVAEYAGERGIEVGIEPLNRYETYLVNRLEQGAELAAATGLDNVGLVADAFHMQLEESDPFAALTDFGPAILGLHLADSTRLGLGHGSLRLEPWIDAVGRGGFDGTATFEFTLPAANPFAAPDTEEDDLRLERYATESVLALWPLDGLTRQVI